MSNKPMSVIDIDGVARNHGNAHNWTKSKISDMKLCSVNGKHIPVNKPPERTIIEQHLASMQAPSTIVQIAKATGVSEATTRKIISNMVSDASVVSTRKSGGNVYKLMATASAAKQTACYGAKYEIYVPPADLPVRADGLDAYRCPSMVGGVEVAYAGIKSQCTGSAADGRSLGR